MTERTLVSKVHIPQGEGNETHRRLPQIYFGPDPVTAIPYPVNDMLVKYPGDGTIFNKADYSVRTLTRTTMRYMFAHRYRRRIQESDPMIMLRDIDSDHYIEKSHLDQIDQLAANPDKFDRWGFVVPAEAFYDGPKIVVKFAAISDEARSNPKTTRRILNNFYYEAAIAAYLDHPHIVRFIGLTGVELNHRLFPGYMMERLKPITQGEEGIPQLSVPEILHIGDQIGGAIDYAHQRGAILWDVKPDSIGMRGNDAVLFDFNATREAALPWENPDDIQSPHCSDPQQKMAALPGMEGRMARRRSFTELPKAADMHAFAMSIYILLQGREKNLFSGPAGTNPDGHHSPEQALLPLPQDIPDDVYYFLNWATHYDRAKRPHSCVALMQQIHQAFGI